MYYYFRQEKIYNYKIKGISLEGTVLDVSGEEVKLHLDVDETQDVETASWFRYAPPTGNVMYSMPIVGTNAYLYFPNEFTQDPIITGGIRTNGSTCEQFSDTNNRYFTTEHGNELDILPDAVNVFRKGLRLCLNDGSGVSISSAGKVDITSVGKLTLDGKTLNIEAKKSESEGEGGDTEESKIHLECQGSYITLKDEYSTSATKVHEDGSDRTPYEDFTDDNPMAAHSNSTDSKSESDSSDSAEESSEDSELANLPEYKTSMQFPDGTRVKVKGLDGQFYKGTIYSKNSSTVFVADNMEGYKNATSANWPYWQTWGCSALDFFGNMGLDLGSLPSYANLKMNEFSQSLFGDNPHTAYKIQQSKETLEYIQKCKESLDKNTREWALESDETYDSMKLLLETGTDLVMVKDLFKLGYKGVTKAKNVVSKYKAAKAATKAAEAAEEVETVSKIMEKEASTEAKIATKEGKGAVIKGAAQEEAEAEVAAAIEKADPKKVAGDAPKFEETPEGILKDSEGTGSNVGGGKAESGSSTAPSKSKEVGNPSSKVTEDGYKYKSKPEKIEEPSKPKIENDKPAQKTKAEEKTSPKESEKVENKSQDKINDKTAETKEPENKKCESDPIDAVTGSLYVPAVDIVLPDIHEEFKIERKYESINKDISVLGRGWKASFDSFLEIKPDKVKVMCTDGHVETFILINGQWINNKGNSKVYVLNNYNNTWELKSFKDKKLYYYDVQGKLIKIINKYGNELTLNYIGNNINTLTTFSNYKLYFTYKENKVIQIKDELGRTVQYKYSGDYLTEVIHVDKGTTKYEYDENGCLTCITDKNGHSYDRNYYDKKGRVIRQDFIDQECLVTYDDSKREITFNYTKSNRIEKTIYNEDKLVIRKIFTDGSTEEYGYDKHQKRIYEKDRNGNETFRVYNEYGSLLKETKPDGLITEYIYDEDQNLIKETDNLGKEVLYAYDSQGNLLEKKTKISINEYRSETYTYDSFGRVITKTDANNNTSKYEYDIHSLVDGKNGKDPVKVITNSGYEYKYEYDEVGRNTSITTKYGTIEFGYDNLNYASRIKDANGNVTLKYYDNMGNLTSVYTPNANIGDSANGQPYKYSYDHMDRLIAVKNPLGAVQQSIRDSEGNIIKEVNPNFYDSALENGGTGVEYVYDKDNRKIKSIYPDGGIERFVYDSNGNVIKHISPEYYNEAADDGLGYSYTYDNMNHLKSIINEEGITEKSFEYDLHGNIVKEIDNEGNASLFKYDLVNNLIEKRVPVEKDDEGKLLYNVTSYEYDKNGNKLIEKHGISKVYEDELCNSFNEIYFKYDAENRLIEVCDKYGAKTKYKYDCLNQKTYESFKINDNTNKVIHYIYDKVGNLIQRKEEIDGGFISPKDKDKSIFAVTNYEYDRNGNVTKIVTPNGYEISRVYDEIDRVIEEFQKDIRSGIYRSKVYEYDKADNIISLSEYSGKDAELINNKYVSENDYDLKVIDRHYKKKENDKKFAEINFEFDQKCKKYKYDEQDRLTHFINASGNTTRLFYDKNDRIIKQVLPQQYDENKDDGAGTVYKYNVQGKVVEVKNALGQTVTKNIYDPKGNLKTSIDGENNKVEYTYTLLGQIKDITTPNSKNENKTAQSYSYDARGNITGIADGNGNETRYLLDDWGRIIQIETPEGGIEKYTYDYAGNITSTTDANGGTIQYFYNSLGQVSKIKDQEGLSEYFYYDEEGNLTKHINRNENVVDRAYNIDKNIVSLEAYNINHDLLESDEEKQAKHNAEISNAIIQNNNNVTIEKPKKRRDFRKKVLDNLEKKEKGLDISENINENISNTEDKIENNSKDQRLQDKYKLNVISQRFKYNPDGTLNNAYTGNMQYNYTYNKEGLLESKSASGKTLLKYTYDKNDNIKTIKDISGKSSIYNYDDADRVTLITDEDKNNLAHYSYYNNGNIKSVTLGNGVKSDYTYDGDGNVQSLVTINADGKVLVDYNYAYDLNGNRLQKVSSKHKSYYSYDSMNRLVDSSYDGRRESFTYDKAGNRLTKTTNDITEQYVYNVKNQLQSIKKENGKRYFTYNKQGNTIKEETSNRNNLFEYNTLNQQVKAITKEGNTLVNRYDTEGLRYEIEENEKLSRFIFNKNGDILVETDSQDEVISRFTRGYEIVAADTKELDQNSNCPTNSSLSRFYYSVDEQGSTNIITDKYGKIRNEYWYDAFGNVLESREDVHNRITYTGQQFDSITQQYYLRARFYNPVVGRFTQEDVYRGDGLNLYAYCGNNPVRYYDPSGYEKVCYKKYINYKDLRDQGFTPQQAYDYIKNVDLAKLGPVKVKVPKNANSDVLKQAQEYVDGCNEALQNGQLSSIGRVSTKGKLRRDASRAARKEKNLAKKAGNPYKGHPGHVPDTTWTNNPIPPSWLDEDPGLNMSIGGQANGYPIGFKPTKFVLEVQE